ncbi:MAG TPA: phage terminase large subunit family protein [Methanosarcinales archaeon]|nr:phage terminase large subunit family protein [Methanosarcinales archaeon]
MSTKINEQESELQTTQEVFERFRSSILNLDPVTFCENNLSLDGHPFRLRGNGYKPFVDIYRYIGLKALEQKSKPIVLVKGRQVGATTMGANLAMYWVASGIFGKNNKPPMRVMHCFPQLDLATYYAKAKLNPTITKSRQVPDKKGKTKGLVETLINPTISESLYYKEFIDGNTISVDSIGIDADRIRGRTYDCMIFDEVQDMFRRAIMNATKLLAQAQHGPKGQGLQIYMGTPKTKDSVYYEMWEKSNQAYYHLGCEGCKEYFPLYTPGSDEWEKTWLDDTDPECEKFNKEDRGFIVKCPHCGAVQDKRDAAERGKWVSLKDESKCEYIGFHINQLYMPIYNKNAILKQKPENNPLSDEMSWNNEILGEFYSGAGLGITADEIRDKCADFDRGFRRTILKEECVMDKAVYMGVDWGKRVDMAKIGKDGNKISSGGKSFTAIVVLKSEGPKLLSIQFATKLGDNSFQYKRDVINQMMINYNVKYAIGDIGYGHEIMGELQNEYGNRFLASEASGNKIKNKIKFDMDDFPKTIRFEKDHHIDELFNLFRTGAIRFPFKSWEPVSWLVNHCASMVAKPQMDIYGNFKFRYAKGPTPNDGLMALLNAYLAYKYDVTGGFKNPSKLFSESSQELRKGLAVGSYCPRLKVM